tara:strand:+ start:755 stop:955 length:201 start_codon:yes stop_codon:yes gene_type:complete
MTEPKFDTGPDSKLAEYTLSPTTSFIGSSWRVEGKTKDGRSFSTSYSTGDQHEKYTGAKCLNWKDL